MRLLRGLNRLKANEHTSDSNMNIHFQEIEPVYGIGRSFHVYVNGEFHADVQCDSASTLWEFGKLLVKHGIANVNADWLDTPPYFAEC